MDFVGWDVTSFDHEGKEIYIEVKSSVGKKFSILNLTANEWKAACDPARRDRYYLFLVTSALSIARSQTLRIVIHVSLQIVFGDALSAYLYYITTRHVRNEPANSTRDTEIFSDLRFVVLASLRQSCHVTFPVDNRL